MAIVYHKTGLYSTVTTSSTGLYCTVTTCSTSTGLYCTVTTCSTGLYCTVTTCSTGPHHAQSETEYRLQVHQILGPAVLSQPVALAHTMLCCHTFPSALRLDTAHSGHTSLLPVSSADHFTTGHSGQGLTVFTDHWSLWARTHSIHCFADSQQH